MTTRAHEIRGRWAKASDGPWNVGAEFQPSGRTDKNPVTPIRAPDDSCTKCGNSEGEWLIAWTFKHANPNTHENAAAIAAAPTDVAYLLARVQELEKDVTQIGQLAGAVAEHPGMTKSRLKLIREICARTALEG